MSWDSIDQAFAKLKSQSPSHWQNYLGFYSSWLGGFFKEPWAMLMPLDDHGFHRGDGVFEAVRIYQGAYIDLPAHLARLQRSAAAVDMEMPQSVAKVQAICVELAKRARVDAGILRLYITRGPGGFSPNPYEVTGHQIYAALTKMRAPEDKLYVQGASAMLSSVPAKDAFWSQIKSCNYLQNVMMKKECVDKGFDFSISVDEQERLCEGATENLMVLTDDQSLLVPKFDYTLRGTTVSEVLQLARSAQSQLGLRRVELADVTVTDLMGAKEAAFVGTTLGVLPVSSVDKKPIGAGVGGPIMSHLHREWMRIMGSEARLRTEF